MAFGGFYSTGAASVANGGTTVTLVGGLTTQLVSGDPFYANNSIGLIDTITDTTHFELRMPWQGSTLVAQSYTVAFFSALRYDAAYLGQGVRDLLTKLDGVGVIYYVPVGQSEPDVSVGVDGQFAIKIVPGAAWTFWVKQLGVWVSVGAPIGLAWKALWSSATSYITNDIVARLGVLYIALQSGSNHAPESSPTYWQVLLQGGNRYDLAFDASDRPDSGDTFRRFIYTTTVQYLSGLSESRAQALIGATSSAVIALQKNGVQFGTITFPASGAAVTISIASPGVITQNAHGMVAGTPVLFTTTGKLPNGIDSGAVYYVVNPTTNTYQIAATPGGTPIATTGSQLGTHNRFTISNGVFASPSATTFAAGDVLTMIAPNPRDETLATLAITLTGYR